ncbi:sensor domain-containing protein [Sanguibacter sp. YZGR15]|uniref:histidine kinase n=1 Tax=Sanguibacter suaedae TaxID=2795737 RepID=A0A934M6Z5_9MICO|nr:sensor domain-containing protein [Sanguibacter suaedae]
MVTDVHVREPQAAAGDAQAGLRRRRAVRPLEDVGFWRGPFSARTWRELGFLLVVMPWSVVGAVYVVVMIALTAGLLVTVVGAGFVLGGMVLGARGLGALDRGLARGMLRADIASPPAFRPRRGLWGSIWAMVSDGAGWRAVAFLVLQFLLSLATLPLALTFLVTPLGAITHWIWGPYLPASPGTDGEMHRGAQLGPSFFVDTPSRYVAFALLGVLLLFVGSAVVRGLAHLHRILAEALLGPTAASLRVASLEHSRGRAVEDADLTLRRIERNLHDGTQARLVAIAMQLGEAKEQAVSSGTPEELTDLISAAHTATKETLVELRELARGIHPPALDNGLAVALETLGARSPLPVTVDVDLPGPPAPRPAEAIETIAYFCVTELLTNAIKHARATAVHVRVTARDRTLHLVISDDGVGGAAILVPDVAGHHSGLVGLAERVRSVDGDFALSSPPGGPTVVTVVLPLHIS